MLAVPLSEVMPRKINSELSSDGISVLPSQEKVIINQPQSITKDEETTIPVKKMNQKNKQHGQEQNLLMMIHLPKKGELKLPFSC